MTTVPVRPGNDPTLYVERAELVGLAASDGGRLRLTGPQPSPPEYVGWLLGRRPGVRMIPTRPTAGLVQAHGIKEPA